MIASLKGELVQKTSGTVVIDVNGVGYEVYLSTTSLAAMPPIGEEAHLHIHTNVRDDAIILFGFEDIDEKKMFQILITVSGIGPKLALSILSGIKPADLAGAVMTRNIDMLTRVPGVGKKTAARLCLDLKDKVGAFSSGDDMNFVFDDHARVDVNVANDVVSALVNLGYPQNRARDALNTVRRRIPPEVMADMQVEQLLRETLRSLA